MKPLYCFKYDEETGKIETIEIPEYNIDVSRYTGRKTYCFQKPRINKSDSHYHIPEAKLDRYVNNKVYTFNSNIQNAKRIILEDITYRQLLLLSYSSVRHRYKNNVQPRAPPNARPYHIASPNQHDIRHG